MAAALLESGLDGLDQHRNPGPPLETNAYHATIPDGMRSLPDNLLDALRALQADKVLTAGLGREFTEAYLKLKQAEWRDAHAELVRVAVDPYLGKIVRHNRCIQGNDDDVRRAGT